jgi:hypothetical protein
MRYRFFKAAFMMLLFVCGALNAQAQNFNLKIKLVDKGSGEPVGYATVAVTPEGKTDVLKYTQSDGNGVGGVTRDKSVILRFPGLGEAGKPPVLPEGGKPIPSSRQDLMNIALVTDVKNQPILLGIIDPVQRKGQLHSPQVGRQVAAGFGNMLHKEGPKFRAKRLQLLLREFFYVV